MSASPDERVTVALVRGLHGLRGAVRVEVLSDTPDRFRPGAVLHVEGEAAPLTVAWTGPSKPGLLLRFKELTSREAVEPLRDRYLEVVPEEPLPEGSWYWHEVIGLEARTTDGELLGTVSDIFRAGAGEVYVVTGGPRGEVLIPAVRSVVTELTPPQGRLIVEAAALSLSALVHEEASTSGSLEASGEHGSTEMPGTDRSTDVLGADASTEDPDAGAVALEPVAPEVAGPDVVAPGGSDAEAREDPAG